MGQEGAEITERLVTAQQQCSFSGCVNIFPFS